MSAMTITAPRRSRARLTSRLAQWLFLAPAVVYIAAFLGYPVYKNIAMGFQDFTATSFYTGQAPWVGLDNYRKIIGSSDFGRTLLNTATFTIGSIAGQFIAGMAIAVFFHRRFRLSGLLRSLLLVPWLLPMIVSSAIWKWILDQDSGLLNRLVAGLHLSSSPIPWLTSTSVAMVSIILVNIWIGIPFNAAILYGGLQDIPDELYEAGALDGATGWKAWRHITWPLLRPVVTVVLVLGVIYTLKVLDVILALTKGGPAGATQTLTLAEYKMSFNQFQFGQGAAYGNILILISLAFALVYLRVNRTAVDE